MEKSLKLKLYLLKRLGSTGPDEFTQCIVVGASERQAREIANEDSSTEGFIWTDGTLVEAIELAPNTNDGVEGIVLWSKEEE